MVTPEIRVGVRKILMNELCISEELIKPEARIFEDLGGDSLCLLELELMLQERFGVKVQLQPKFLDEQLVADGQGLLTAESVQRAKQLDPSLDFSAFEKYPHKNRLLDLFTVRAIEQCVAAAIAKEPKP